MTKKPDSTNVIGGLRRAGLSEKASAVYAYLLEAGGAYPSKVAAATKLNRSTVYKILTELSIQGLVSEIEKGKKLFYQLERPGKLLRHASRRVERAEDELESLKSFFPVIEGLYEELPSKPRISYFEGIEGVMSVYDDHLSHKGYEMVGFADTDRIQEFLPPTYFKKYRQAKQKQKVTTRGILPDDGSARAYAKDTYADLDPAFRPKLRFIPRERFPFKGEITAYGDTKVSVINLEKNEPSAFIVEDASFNKMMRTMFELSWAGLG